MMGESELKERLARIEVLLEGIMKRMDGDETHRRDCYTRFDTLETWMDQRKGASDATDKMLGKIVSVITIINIITLLSLKVIFHI